MGAGAARDGFLVFPRGGNDEAQDEAEDTKGEVNEEYGNHHLGHGDTQPGEVNGGQHPPSVGKQHGSNREESIHRGLLTGTG